MEKIKSAVDVNPARTWLARWGLMCKDVAPDIVR
jgi:hypothetical protein